jgi:hypothetical protein
MVNRDDYKAMLDKAVGELEEAQNRQAEIDAERDQLDGRIAELKQGIMALAPLCGIHAQLKYADLLPEYNVFLTPGLKEAVVAVLGMVSNGGYITPVAIRDGLTATGYEIKSKNILPSIHNVLKRLEKATPPEVESTDLNGKTGYRLVKKPTGTKYVVQDAGGAPPITRPRLTREQAAIKAEERDIESLKRRVPPIKVTKQEGDSFVRRVLTPISDGIAEEDK